MFKCELRANRCQGVDENIAAAVIDQLADKDVEIRRVSHLLPEGTPDPDILAYSLKRLSIDLIFDTILH